MRTRRSYLILLGLILAALTGVALLAIPGAPGHKKVTLGLDLQGGLEVVLKAVPPKGHVLTSADLDNSVNIMRNRIDKLGVAEPEIRKQGSNQIVVELPGVHNAAQAAKVIGTTAELQMYDLEADLTGPSVTRQGVVTVPVAATNLNALLKTVQAAAKIGTPSAYFVFNKNLLVKPATGGPPDGGPFDTRAQAEKRRQTELLAHKSLKPSQVTILEVPQHMIVITCGTEAVVCPGNGVSGLPPTRTYYYLFKHTPPTIPELTGRDLSGSGTAFDFDPNGLPIVRIGFTGKGNHKFQEITRGLYVRGRIQQSPQHFAIVLDGDIKSFPQIDYTDSSLSSGISGGAQITGLSSQTEGKNLALVLQSGALPVSFVQIERTDVSATLGKDSLQQAKRAALIGLLVVALFLLVFYRFLGLVAVLGLGIYAAFMYGAIVLIPVTMTLPGFAGLILTIGVAADANVVIFERIKEEVRSGKSIRAAISAGYAKGFRTIVDANVVTCITALVLFGFATAGVKGFALMLLIGTIISLVTAVAATRAMLGLLAGFRWFDNPSFMGAQGQQGAKWLQIDFMRRRYVWLAISGTVVLISAVSLGVKGLNLGIDFKGGTQITFKTPDYVSLAKVRAQAADVGQRDAVVQGRGSSRNGDQYKSFQLRTKSLSSVNQDRLTSDLQQRVGASSLGVQSVSSSFGHQIAVGAIWAIFGSLLLIVLYIAIRFDYKFALPVIVALIHDIAITVGIYSLTGREVTTSTVAAVLTVLGYSIYDTIIIFDRIRENVPLMRRASFATIANVSLWETIRRSLATTFITLLPVTALLLFGGATLKDFAFALLIGIGSGAYSSIFIAAPLLTMWKEREPEYRRRIGEDLVESGAGQLVLAQGETAVPVAAAAPAAAAPEPAATTVESKAEQAKRERRRQRRKSRPHGRSR